MARLRFHRYTRDDARLEWPHLSGDEHRSFRLHAAGWTALFALPLSLAAAWCARAVSAAGTRP